MTVPLLEICVADVSSLQQAVTGGARRVEVCTALGEGGLTPSLALVERALTYDGLEVRVLIRCRCGDFIYSPAEVDVMVRDIEAFREIGAHGVVIGALREDGNLDVDALLAMTNAAGTLKRTFHRAIDLAADPLSALNQIIDMRFDSVLTSGHAPSAQEGLPMLRRMVKAASGRIEIIGAAGINAENARCVASSGVDCLHASAKKFRTSPMAHIAHDVAMGAQSSDFCWTETSASEVADILASLT